MNLIFDFGKVLVDFDFEAFFRKYIPDTERCYAFLPVLYNDNIAQRLDRELQSFDEIIAEVIAKNPDFEPEIRLFCEHYPEIVTHEIEGMYNLLSRLKAEGHKLYGLTNWCSKVHITMTQFPIFQLLDGQIISSEEHVIKPEPEIYHRLFTKFNLKPEECIFTDDRAENVDAGRRLGMKGIVFKDAKQYERELRGLLKYHVNQ
ncbi:MAG: HAD family phosphatase [Bacteroidales bacterium]|nr:HAD family phosphatase [Bacteroidales bacterium]